MVQGRGRTALSKRNVAYQGKPFGSYGSKILALKVECRMAKNNSSKYEDLAKRVGALVDVKNKAYGDSFHKAGEFLQILYPNGIPPEKYIDALCIVRIFDKLMRIATKKDAFGESPYGDILGYALLGLDNDEKKERDA